jgi:hypothetical protein
MLFLGVVFINHRKIIAMASLEGITIYERENLDAAGKNDLLGVGEYPNMAELGYNNSISSIEVHENYYAEIYQDTGMSTSSSITPVPTYLFPGEYPNFPQSSSSSVNWNNNISSIVVKKHLSQLFPSVEFYTGNNYTGNVQRIAATLESGEYKKPFYNSNTIDSMKVPDGVTVTLYDGADFNGRSRRFIAGEYSNLGLYRLGNRVESIKIEAPNLEIVKIECKQPSTPLLPIDDDSIISLSSKTTNSQNAEVSTTLRLRETVTTSTTHTLTESIFRGKSIEVSASFSLKADWLGAEFKTAITRTINKTKTVSDGRMEAEEQLFEKSVTTIVPPGATIQADVTLQSTTKIVEAVYTLISIIPGVPRSSRPTIDVEGEIEIDTYYIGEAEVKAV